jgi:phage-related protein
MKSVIFLGNTLVIIRAFPESVKFKIGGQLYLVQIGADPDDWKPMPTIGKGVREIRIRDISGAYRVIYVTNIGPEVVVLNAFIKKTQATPQREIDLARKRLKELL